MTIEQVTPQQLKPRLTGTDEIAFLDVREHGQSGEGHPFFSTPLPYSELESRAKAVLPCRSTALIVMDDGDGVARKAAERLMALGYSRVSELEGGAPGWAAAGYTLYKGVHVPSKTFGELLEHAQSTPNVTATELHGWQEEGRSLIVLDGRSPAEFRKMSLPAAVNCPNAELGFRFGELVPNDSTVVVINCAGRTRSILGVEGLRLLNVSNPLYALENGTQGWRLAGFDLEHGVEPTELPNPSAARLRALAQSATDIAAAHDIPRLAVDELSRWLRDDSRTTYVFDVRTSEEFAYAHWPAARHAPGGQLVQTTDRFIAVRNARVVLCDDVGLRAATTAVRLKQMGHDVHVLDADARSFTAGVDKNDVIDKHEAADQFRRCAENTSLILDASKSMAYRKAHIAGSQWATRARLDYEHLKKNDPILVTGRRQDLVDGVATDCIGHGVRALSCVGSPEIWAAAGYEVVSSPQSPPDEECIDYLFFVHDRHDGNLDAARQYLEWEVGLVNQLDEQERSVFAVHSQAQ